MCCEGRNGGAERKEEKIVSIDFPNDTSVDLLRFVDILQYFMF